MLTYAKSGIKQASCMNHAEVKDQEYEVLVLDCRGDLHVCVCVASVYLASAMQLTLFAAACSLVLHVASMTQRDTSSNRRKMQVDQQTVYVQAQ